MEYESNGNRSERLSTKQYFDGIKPYLKAIIISKNMIHGKFN